MKLCTQYYRPPFPETHRWHEDLARIKETGFDAIVLTASWAWLEPEPGTFDFTDFDALIEDAGRAGLQVIVNTWSELQPVWIHREVPDGHMVDHLGRAVVSSPLAYAQFGIMPGGCTDHPRVRELAGRFLTTTAERYADTGHILLWDCWNEIRWLTQSDGYVCHCEHTVARFREWLDKRHGGLDGLNAAWHRRYRTWQDVQPSKLPTRTYSDTMAFGAFLTDRAAEDLVFRRDAVRAGDPARPVVAHTAFPSAYCTGEFFEYEPALARGNDFHLADQVDGFGSSYFPAWIHTAPIDFAARLEATRSAVGGKQLWISELQGGAAGHGLQAMNPVPGRTQARWVWNGVARGAKGISFWCWRDEVFGRESAGFGIVGEDGHRDERLAELRRTADLFAAHGDLLDAYRPAQAAVGIVLEPGTYHLDWASTLGAGLTASASDPFQAGHSVQGYLRALERLQIPYDVVDPEHATDLSAYRFLVLPWPLLVDPAFGARVADWVRGGGTLLVEAELDAFDASGLYRYQGERPFAAALGIEGAGRRKLTGRPLPYEIDGVRGELPAATWLVPQRADGAEVLAGDASGAMVVRRTLGSGHVVSVGTYPGLAYWQERHEGFEAFLTALIGGADALPPLTCDRGNGEVVQWRFGPAGDAALLFVVNEGDAVDAVFDGPEDLLPPDCAGRDLATGADLPVTRAGGRLTLRVPLSAGGYHVVELRAG
ncbi:beta-galactosidase [Rhizohabitans arisaemae]|uniref:beta-galactosidase n=1 Tax=Rhizohabitans arisaemae TaxID=2720610 RepID=UPI0024B046CF|nr:alpha-amylase family protein [Rhizohabitans arisaemae]